MAKAHGAPLGANGTKLPLGLPPEIAPLLGARAAFAGTASDFKNFLRTKSARPAPPILSATWPLAILRRRNRSRRSNCLARKSFPISQVSLQAAFPALYLGRSAPSCVKRTGT